MKGNFLNRSFIYASQKLLIAFIAIKCTSSSIKWFAHTLEMLILGFMCFLPSDCSYIFEWNRQISKIYNAIKLIHGFIL